MHSQKVFRKKCILSLFGLSGPPWPTATCIAPFGHKGPSLPPPIGEAWEQGTLLSKMGVFPIQEYTFVFLVYSWCILGVFLGIQCNLYNATEAVTTP